MSIAVTESFLESVFLLEKKIRKYTLATINALENNPQSDALKIHKIDKTRCDPSFRSARVNDDIRIIFSANGSIRLLLYAGHHEDAYNWCEGKFLSKNSFGAEMLYDEKLIRKVSEEAQSANLFAAQAIPLLSLRGIKAKHLMKLSIPEVHANNLLAICDEDVFLDYIQIFPAELQEALLSLEAGEKTLGIILNELAGEDYGNASFSEQKDNRRRFHMLQSLDELESILNEDDFERWTLFLHPAQEKLVEKNFNGPALIEGGPGTGKTIVGIHRAVYLSKNVFKPSDNKRILFCTFSKKLARNISDKLHYLQNQKGIKENNIDVLSVDAYIRRLYLSAFDSPPRINDRDIRELLSNMYAKLQPSGSLAFYQFEYLEIIERLHITSLDEYIAAERFGGNLPLNARQRTRAWEFFGAFLNEKTRQGLMSFVDVAHIVSEAMSKGLIKCKYDSVIIDEAQDLEPVKLYVLSHSVISETNNVFILSDVNQRIFKLTSWRKDSDINIVGRSYYLYINYRTTKQISDYARTQFIKSEMVKTHIREYKSIVNGMPPTICGFENDLGQRKYIVSRIKDLLTICPAEQICVICPNKSCCEAVSAVLSYEEIKATILQDDVLPLPGNGVSVCPITGVKGLEFRIVIIYDYTKISGRQFTASYSEAIKDTYDKLAECAKYVATTRARDELIITYTEEGESV